MAIPNVIDRLKQAQDALFTPSPCEECGSTYFVAVHAHQYSRAGYGSIEFRQISSSPVPVKICVGCGRPIGPTPSSGKLQSASTPEFQASMEAGEIYRNKLRANAAAVASKRELEALKKQVEELTALLQSGNTPVLGPAQIGSPGTEEVETKPASESDTIVIDQPQTPPILDEAIPDHENLPALMQKRSGKQTRKR